MSRVPGLNTAILDFCTRLDDGPRDEAAARRELPKRDPADYVWLREVIASIEQPEDVLKKHLKVIFSDRSDPATLSSNDRELVNSLEELMDMVEDLNWATEFMLMKGVDFTLRAIAEVKDAEIRRLLAMIIAQAAQNHDKLQAKFVAGNFEKVLIPLLAAEESAPTRAALVFAVSCICRGYPPASSAFLNAGGLGAILSVITTCTANDPKSVGRALRLAGYFADEDAVTANPMADAACQLAVRPLQSTDNQDEVEVVVSAAECSRQIVDRALAAGTQGLPLACRCVQQLTNWAEHDATSAEVSDSHKALLASYRRALVAVGGTESSVSAGTTNSNKASAVSHVPTTAGPEAIDFQTAGPASGTHTSAPLLLGCPPPASN